MKAFKRFGAVLATLLALTVVLTGTALAAEPGGGISVQLNGKLVSFPDAAPEFSGGRTFVPLRAVLEAMDAQVDYDSQTNTVNIHRNGVDLSMVLGRNAATVTENGQTHTLTMDVVPYVKNDRTYVPVRFVAEAFGCSVGWDAEAQTVVIVDVDALLGDATFGLMDSFAAYCEKQNTGNMAITGNLALDVADQSGEFLPVPVSAKGSLDGISGDKGAQLDWKLELSDLSALLGVSLPSMEGEVRMDLEPPAVYLSMPAILTGGGENTWYSLDLEAYQAQLLGGLDMTQLTQLEGASIRETLMAVLQSIPLEDSQSDFDTLALVSSIYVNMLSDQAFVQNGDTYVAQMTLEDIVNITVTLTKQGNDIVAADIKLDCDVTDRDDRITMTMTEHAAPDKVTVDINMDLASGDVSIKLGLDITGTPTQKVPVVVPPTGAQIIPMN